LKQFGKDRNKL